MGVEMGVVLTELTEVVSCIALSYVVPWIPTSTTWPLFPHRMWIDGNFCSR